MPDKIDRFIVAGHEPEEPSPVLFDSVSCTYPEIGLEDIEEVLNSTIIDDRVCKEVVFLGLLLNYTEKDQQSIGFTSVSSSGKTWVTLETAKLFPVDDVVHIQHYSPKAFYHQHGVQVTDTTGTSDYGAVLPSLNKYVFDNLVLWETDNPMPEPRQGRGEWKDQKAEEKNRLEEEWESIEKAVLVDLDKKILIFVDQPDWHLLEDMKPIMSHDKRVMRSSITDKTKSGSMAAKTVLLRGYPTFVFLTVETNLDEQVNNRMIWLSASATQPKLEGSLRLIGTTNTDPDHEERINKDPKRTALRERLVALKAAHIAQVLFRPGDMEQVLETFFNEHPTLIPRHQRDFPRLLAIIKAHALMNWTQRERDTKGTSIYVNRIDIDAGRDLYHEIAEANELGIDPELYDFARGPLAAELEKNGQDGIRLPSGFRLLWHGFRGSQLKPKELERKIEMLEMVGLAQRGTDPDDKRKSRLYDANTIPATEQKALDVRDRAA